MIFNKVRIIKKKNRDKTSSSQISRIARLRYISHRAQEIIDFDYRLDQLISVTSMNIDFRTILKRYIRGSTASTYSRQLAEHNLAASHNYPVSKRKRNALLNNVASKYNIVTASIVRAKKQKRDENEMLKAQKTIEAAEARLKKEKAKAERDRKKTWNKLFSELKKEVKARNKRKKAWNKVFSELKKVVKQRNK